VKPQLVEADGKKKHDTARHVLPEAGHVKQREPVV
jgi:hypothetical protein